MAVADVYDALTSSASTKPGVSHEQTTVEIVNGAETYFVAPAW
jgi:HD-GYP domain-containing protein (c-di-GMP phosphodiesterase class II)